MQQIKSTTYNDKGRHDDSPSLARRCEITVPDCGHCHERKPSTPDGITFKVVSRPPHLFTQIRDNIGTYFGLRGSPWKPDKLLIAYKMMPNSIPCRLMLQTCETTPKASNYMFESFRAFEVFTCLANSFPQYRFVGLHKVGATVFVPHCRISSFRIPSSWRRILSLL